MEVTGPQIPPNATVVQLINCSRHWIWARWGLLRIWAAAGLENRNTVSCPVECSMSPSNALCSTSSLNILFQPMLLLNSGFRFVSAVFLQRILICWIKLLISPPYGQRWSSRSKIVLESKHNNTSKAPWPLSCKVLWWVCVDLDVKLII